MATIASLNIALSADSAKLKKDLKGAGKATDTWAKKQKAKMKSVTGAAKGLGAAMGAMVAVMGVGKLLDNADALGKNAAAAGMSIEAFQRLEFGFAQAGISAAGFTKGQAKVNKVMLDASNGSKLAVENLAKIGLTVEDLAALKPEERMLAIADGLAEIQDAGTRAALSAELLGKEMATVGLDSAAIKADGDTIAVTTQEAADAAAKMNDAMGMLSTTIQNLLTNAIVPFIANIQPAITAIASLAKDNPTMAAALGGMALLGIAFTVMGGPITLIVAAITAAMLVFSNWDSIVRGLDTFLTDTFGVSLGDIADKLQPVADIMTTIGSIMWDNLKGMWNLMKQIFSGDFSGLKDKLMGVFSSIGDAFGAAFKAPLNAAIKAVEQTINGVLKSIEDMIANMPLIGKAVNLGRVSLPAFATGGYVSGAGTGTSDSITARLSDGEFVVNAKATAKNRSELEAINSGKSNTAGGTGGTQGSSSIERIRAKRIAETAMWAQKDYLIRTAANKAALALQAKNEQDQIDLTHLWMQKSYAVQTAVRDEQAKDTVVAISEQGKAAAESLASTFESGLSNAIKTGDFSNIGASLVDNFSNSIIDSFSSTVTDSLFGGGLSDMIGGLFGGGGGGGGMDWMGLASSAMSIFGFADGGLVPTTSTSKSYADSVPAMLQPGELVVPKSQVDNFLNGAGGGGGQVFNINVTGDISNLTRREIVKMMPQIAAGVNANNFENNRR